MNLIQMLKYQIHVTSALTDTLAAEPGPAAALLRHMAETHLLVLKALLVQAETENERASTTVH